MLFYLTTLSLAKFLYKDPSELTEGETNKGTINAWKHSNFLCRNYILNSLDNTLYNVYLRMELAKALWDSFDKKYKTEDVGMKKFIVGKFLNYKMVDVKSVIS